jgi:hypothetical protein
MNEGDCSLRQLLALDDLALMPRGGLVGTTVYYRYLGG